MRDNELVDYVEFSMMLDDMLDGIEGCKLFYLLLYLMGYKARHISSMSSCDSIGMIRYYLQEAKKKAKSNLLDGGFYYLEENFPNTDNEN